MPSPNASPVQSALHASPQGKAVFRLKPFVIGAKTRHRAIVRTADSPDYLGVTVAELEALRELEGQSVSLESYFGRHLGGRHGLSFNEAMTLLLRLHAARFLDPDPGEDTLEKLAGIARASRPGRLRHWLSAFTSRLDFPLIEPFSLLPTRALARFGKLLLCWPVILGLVAIVAMGSLRLDQRELAALRLLRRAMETPERFLLELLCLVSLATSALALFRAAMLGGLGSRFVPGTVRLTGFLFPRLEIRSDEALMASRGRYTRFYLVSALLPWAICFGLLELTGRLAMAPLGRELATASAAMGIIGIIMLCPLYRSPLVRLAEGWLAAFDLLRAGQIYLHHGMFKSLVGKDRSGRPASDHGFEWAVVLFSSAAMVWLYFVGRLCLDTLLEIVPPLVVQAERSGLTLRSLAAVLTLGVVAGSLVFCLGRLVLIPIRNFASVVSVPLRRARRGRAGQPESPEAVVAFLREIPFFGNASDQLLQGMSERMGHLKLGRGRRIIEQGEKGEEFFLLASGEAQVLRMGTDGSETVINTLRPGDGFGEVALIEHCSRTATVRTTMPSEVYFLDRRSFDQLFPEGSEERAHLTFTLRLGKLILDSQALSHLSSRQVRELLAEATMVAFAPRDRIVREGEAGDAVFLLADGRAEVLHGQEKVAELGPGELVGIISLVKGISRTADVVATTPVRALRIEASLFLRLCLANPVVALLVSDLTEKQSSELLKAGGA